MPPKNIVDTAALEAQLSEVENDLQLPDLPESVRKNLEILRDTAQG